MMDRENGIQFINTEKWVPILQNFVHVLRLNLFIVNLQGRPIVTSRVEGYGWRLLMNSPGEASNMFSDQDGSWLNQFKKNGDYLEYRDIFGLSSFAIPLEVEHGEIVGYLIVGPIIFNKRQDNSEYREIARSLGMSFDELINEIDEIRVVSFLGVRAILDLLHGVSEHMIQLAFERYRDVQRFLTHILDTAVTMTDSEGGSVMVLDEKSQELILRAWQGAPEHKFGGRVRVKLGDGIAGLAAKENSAFIIHDGAPNDQRISHLLKRPEIKHSLVMPLVSPEGIFGVLNLHTTKDENGLDEENMESIRSIYRCHYLNPL